MEIVAGVVGPSGSTNGERCRQLLLPLLSRGHDPRLTAAAGACFGAGQAFSHNSQVPPPAQLLREGQLLAVAAGTITNRWEVARALQLPPNAPLASLLAEAWQAWGLRIGDRVAGDWVLAHWDREQRELALLRAPVASTSLFFTDGAEGPLFATLAQGLARSGLVDREPDWPAMAIFLRDFAYLEDRTAFAGIRRVRAGHVQRWQGGRWSEQSIWSPSAKADPAPRDWVKDYRRLVEESVAAVLPPTGTIASQLSGGRDSSAVTAIAARQAPSRVVAITLVPRPGTVRPSDHRLIFDEGPAAQATARFLGIRHIAVDGGTPDQQLRALKQAQRWLPFPTWSAAAPGVWSAMGAAAAGLGASTMLAGGLGNLGLSSGGHIFLSALRAEQGISAWWPVARAFARAEGWRTVIHHSAPVPARMAWRAFRERREAQPPPYWRGPLATAGQRPRPRTTGVRTARAEVLGVINELDIANPFLQVEHGVALADPTADRRLLELMLQAPASLLVSPGNGRPLYEAAFRDLLPPELLSERRRGRQVADWWRAFDPQALQAIFEELSAHRLVSGVLDVPAIQARLRHWPTDFDSAFPVDDDFRQLLSSLSLALFLHEHF